MSKLTTRLYVTTYVTNSRNLSALSQQCHLWTEIFYHNPVRVDPARLERSRMLSGHLNCILFMKLKIFHQLCGGKYNIIFRFTDLSFTLVTLLRRVFRLSRNTRYWTHSSLIHNFHTSLHGYSLLLQLPTAWTVDSDANFGCLGFH